METRVSRACSRRRFLAVLLSPGPRSLADYRHETAWYHGDSLFHQVVSFALQQMNPITICFFNVLLLLLFGFVIVAGTWRRHQLHWMRLWSSVATSRDLKLDGMLASSGTWGWIKTVSSEWWIVPCVIGSFPLLSCFPPLSPCWSCIFGSFPLIVNATSLSHSPCNKLCFTIL